MAEPLSREQIDEALRDLNAWRYESEALHRSFEFGSFREALAFIVRIAFEAEQRDHHPEITNVYNRVELALTTHDAGDRVTKKDVALAEAIEALA
jgi:4a-hydroxytetrahydrobiopterin dehydratase